MKLEMSEETSFTLVFVAIVAGVVACVFAMATCSGNSNREEQQTEREKTTKLLEQGYELRVIPGVEKPVWIKPAK